MLEVATMHTEHYAHYAHRTELCNYATMHHDAWGRNYAHRTQLHEGIPAFSSCCQAPPKHPPCTMGDFRASCLKVSFYPFKTIAFYSILIIVTDLPREMFLIQRLNSKEPFNYSSNRRTLGWFRDTLHILRAPLLQPCCWSRRDCWTNIIVHWANPITPRL